MPDNLMERTRSGSKQDSKRSEANHITRTLMSLDLSESDCLPPQEAMHIPRNYAANMTDEHA